MKNHKCRTYFRIIGDIEANELLSILNVKADKIINKGDVNPRSQKVWEYNDVKIGLNEKYNIDINEMIRETLKNLIPQAEMLANLKKEYNLGYYLVLVPEIYSDSDEPKQYLSLERDIIEFLYLTGAEVDLDYYVC